MLAAAVVATVSGGSIGGIVCGGASVRSLVGVEGVLGIPIAVHATCLSHSHGIRRPSIGGSFCVQASVRGLIGAGGVLRLCRCGSCYALAATATAAVAGGCIGCSRVQPQMQLSAAVASAAAVCGGVGYKSPAAGSGIIGNSGGGGSSSGSAALAAVAEVGSQLRL